MAEVSMRAEIIAVTELPSEKLNQLFIKKSESPQKALDEAIKKIKSKGISIPKILILPDGCVTIPVPIVP